MFYGANLNMIRQLHSLSRKELGALMNLSEQAIWQFENDVTSPSFKTIVQLKQILQVKTTFFFEPLVFSNKVSAAAIAYRRSDSLSNKQSGSEYVYLNAVLSIIEYLESFLNPPLTNLMTLRNDIHSTVRKIETKTISNIADKARNFLAIDEKNENVLLSLERAGIHIVEKNIGEKIDAYSTWSKNNIPVIVLGVKKSAVRRQFDLAHELGHLLLHPHIEFKYLERSEQQQFEDEANYFASCFLLPEKQMHKEFQTLTRLSNPDTYIALKNKYHVSIQALEMRAYRLGYLTQQQHSYFYRQINIKGYRKEEPLDREIPIKRPGKIRSILNLILSNHLTNLPSILNHLNIERSLLEELFFIEPAFLSKYNTEDTFTQFDNILKMDFK